MPDRGPLADYPEAARAQALAHFAQLRPHLEDGVPLTRLARELDVSLRTLQRHVRAYRHHGLVGLCPPLRTGAAPRRTDPELVALIEGLALRNPPPSAASIYRQVRPIAEQHGWPMPTSRTVRDIVAHLDPGLPHPGP